MWARALKARKIASSQLPMYINSAIYLEDDQMNPIKSHEVSTYHFAQRIRKYALPRLLSLNEN